MKLQQKCLSTISMSIFLMLFVFGNLSINERKKIVAGYNVYAATLSVEEIISRFKNRYDILGFQTNFYQTVTLSHMGTTDIAYGRLSVLKPDKVRWEYTRPYSQIIIYNNDTICIFNPEDEQVVVVDGKLFIEKGIDISFILDIGSIQDNFSIYLEEDLQDLYQLRLVRKETPTDLSSKVYILISKVNYDLVQVKVITSYGDETIIKLNEIDLESVPSPNVFKLDIQENVDILELDG